jgi:GTPase SAR1 family protein
MTVKRRKPILVAGIGISILLGLWDSFHQEVVQVGQWGLLVAIALGTGFWFFQTQTTARKLPAAVWSPLKRDRVEQAIAQAQATLTTLATEAPERDIAPLKQQLEQLPTSFNRRTLQIAIAGGKKVGKSALMQVLATQNLAGDIHLIETDALFSEGAARASAAQGAALACDLVLFLTTGDLTESEWQMLQQFGRLHQRLILLLNKQDQYVPEERTLILQQLRQRVQELIPREEVIAIAAAPQAVKVRQHQEDGSVAEWMEQQAAEIGALSDRLQQILSQEREPLIWGTIWREAMNLQQAAKAILNQVRRDRAMPAIEQYQWIAAAAAFANPVAALDLLATAAINAQMLVDLSSIYQQKFSLSQAQSTSGTLGKLMVQLGLVELSTQTIASLLKSNAVTYVAGSTVQGVSAAYLTRLAGLSLIEYFQDQEISTTEGLNLEKLAQKFKQVFEANQRSAFLASFVRQAITHLCLTPPQSPATNSLQYE